MATRPDRLRDPRSHRRYVEAAARYIAASPNPTPCALCGDPVDTPRPRTTPRGPPIEHRYQDRRILAAARPQAAARAQTSDVQLGWLRHPAHDLEGSLTPPPEPCDLPVGWVG